ncbi:MAG: glycosyltransferase family 2 protein [Bacteroidales bacterium]|jgi:glycosyltransferase involved in cell wall biosynthesis|nr:glycosyltransferase family 2 protein [Bacteroidales bacterium]
MPKISVVLPFFNAQNSLQLAIESVTRQSFKDFECLLVNNNSTDKSVEIATAFVGRDSRFILLNEHKQGVSYASNLGSQHARGVFIARMDADDLAAPNRLKLQYEFLIKNPDFGVVAGHVDFGGDKQNAAGLYRYTEWVNSLKTPEAIALRRFVESPVINPSAMWRKSIEDSLGGYEHGDFPEDYDMWLRWIDAGVKIGKIPETLLQWNDNSTRLTRTDERYSTEAFYQTKAKYLAKSLEKINRHYPKVYVWGASRIMRNRAAFLLTHDIEIEAYIDISEKRKIKENLLFYKDIPSPENAFILVFVPQTELKQEILNFLLKKGYVEGINFLFVA